jgi:hypothetical protein
MSEPVYHALSISGAQAEDAATVTYAKVEQLSRLWDLSRETTSLRFTTPWEPQLALVLEISKQFPDCEFELSIEGSIGTTIEDYSTFLIKDGVILAFKAPMFEGEGEAEIMQKFHLVLKYCVAYVDSPVVHINAVDLDDVSTYLHSAPWKATQSDVAARFNEASANTQLVADY